MPFSQISIQDRTGLLFFQAMNGAFGSAINTSTAIPAQLQVVSRERTAGMYKILPFYAATFVALIPLDTLPVLFNASAIYFVANLRHGAEHFFICEYSNGLSPLTALSTDADRCCHQTPGCCAWSTSWASPSAC